MGTAEHDACPVRDEGLGSREPEAAAAAGHQVYAAAQSEVHPAILPGPSSWLGATGPQRGRFADFGLTPETPGPPGHWPRLGQLRRG
jgi:hypothetical protein